jgi:hypothetical protein
MYIDQLAVKTECDTDGRRDFIPLYNNLSSGYPKYNWHGLFIPLPESVVVENELTLVRIIHVTCKNVHVYHLSMTKCHLYLHCNRHV